MNDLVSFAAHAVFWACVAMVAVGAAIAIGGDIKLYGAMVTDPARWLAWAGCIGAVGGVSYRLTKD